MTFIPYSREVARKSGSNFYLSFFFLPPVRRNAILVIYAFSRLVDDAVDNALSDEQGRAEISLWKQRLESCYQFESTPQDHPILPELCEVIRTFQIPKEYLSDLLIGMEMDLTQKRYAHFLDLEKYCYHVAGTIGLLCNHIFGLQDESGRRYAILLGTAFQLTNIIRDVGNDALLGRIYLPQDEMKTFGVSESDLLRRSESESLSRLLFFQAERAEKYFREAYNLLDRRQRRKLLPAAIMSAVYHRILHKLQKERFPVFRKKMGLSKPEKMYLLLETLIKSLI